MIRRQQDGAFFLIAQHDHALLSGRLMKLAGNDRFARPTPWRDVVRGAGWHDSGWPLHDEHPTLNPAGLPLDVFETTPDIGLRVWGESVQAALRHGPYAGLLVSLHVLALSVFATSKAPMKPEGFRMQEPRIAFEVNKFQHKQVEIQECLRRRLGFCAERALKFGLAEGSHDPHEQQLVYNFRLLQAMDQLSLALCCTTPPMAQTTPLPIGPGRPAVQLSLRRHGHDLHVAPWPFGLDRIALRLPYRRLPASPFEDATALRSAYAQAAREQLELCVCPG